MDIGLNQAMGADNNVKIPFCKLIQCILLLLTAAEATQHFNSYTKGIHAVLKGDEMLLGKNRRRGHDSHLLAVHDRFESCPDGNFRLAVSHVAAQKTLHGNRLFHISLDFLDGFKLIWRFLKRKTVLKFFLPRRIRGKSMSRRNLSLGIKAQELRSKDGDSFLGLFLGFLPIRAAHTG